MALSERDHFDHIPTGTWSGAYTRDISEIEVLCTPEYKWIFKMSEGLHYFKNSAPCAFHRIMQKIFFGFVWERIEGVNNGGYKTKRKG